jgi:tetratricopeptide (TPR) repeat protein
MSKLPPPPPQDSPRPAAGDHDDALLELDSGAEKALAALESEGEDSGENGDGVVELEAEPIEAEPIEPIEAEPIEAELIEAEPIEAEPVEAEPIETAPFDDDDIDSVDALLDDSLKNGSAGEPEPKVPATNEGAAFFQREAEASAESQSERAALMWIEAATELLRSGGSQETIREHIEKAIEARPNAPWLLDRARRLLVQLRQYEQALKIAQRRVKLGGDNSDRAAVLLECAALVRYQAARPDVAASLLQQALSLYDTYVPALSNLASVTAELGRHQESASALERLADCLTDPGQRSLCLFRAAVIRELCLDDADAGQLVYGRAVETDPHNVVAAFALCEVHRRAQRWPELCRALEQLSNLIDDDAYRSELLYEAGLVHLEHTGDIAAAARDLAKAAQDTPENQQVLAMLARAYTIEGKKGDTIRTLRRMAQLKLDKAGRAMLLTRIGALHGELHQYDEAAASYREALEEAPGYLPAIQELGSLCRKRGDFEGLVDIAREENEGMLPAGSRAMRYLELGDILDSRLERPEQAIDAYRRAIELSSDFHLAFWRLEALLARLKLYEPLAELFAQHADICQDSQSKAFLLRRRAQVQASGLEDREAAIATLVEANALETPPTLRFDLVDLCIKTKRFEELVPLLLKLAAQTRDAREAEDRRIQAAIVLSQELAEHDRAIELLNQVIESNPGNHPAIQASGRILHRSGAWQKLVKLYVHELDQDKDRPDAAVMLTRMGNIIETRIGNRSAALQVYGRALKVDPGYEPARIAMEHLAHAEGTWSELITVLCRCAEAYSDPQMAAAALTRAADLTSRQLEKHERAVELYDEALLYVEDHLPALLGKAAVLARLAKWQPMVETLESASQLSTGEKRALLIMRRAQLLERRLGQKTPITLYEQAKEASFGRQLREELTAAWQRVGDDAVAEKLFELGQDTADDPLAAAYLLDSAHRIEFSSQSGDSLEALRAASDRRPGDLPVVWALERAFIATERWNELARLSERQARQELDRIVRVQHLGQAAAAYHRANEGEEAKRICRESLNFDVHSMAALRTLAKLAEENERWAELAEASDRLAEACHDSENRLQSCLRAAQVWAAQVSDSTRARASLAVALSHDPDQPYAFDHAERLLSDEGDYDELNRLYARRIRATSDEQIRVDLLWRRAKLLRDELSMPDAAISELNDLVRLRPNDSEALMALAELHELRGHWSDVATTLQAVIERASSDESVARAAKLRLVQLWLERLHDPARARQLLDELPDEADVRRMRVQLATTVGDWNEARQMLEALSEQQSAAEQKLWALIKLSEVATLGLHDDALAEKALQQALEVAAVDSAMLGELLDHFKAKEERRQLVDSAERMLKTGGGSVAVRELVARLALEELDDPRRALPHIDALRKRDESTELALMHARALGGAGDNQAALKICRQLIEQDPTSVAAHRATVLAATSETAAAAASIVELFGEPLEAEEVIHLKTLARGATPRGKLPSTWLRVADELAEFEQQLQLLQQYAASELAPEPQLVSGSHEAVAMTKTLAECFDVECLGVELSDKPGARPILMPDGFGLRINSELASDARSVPFRTWVGRAMALGCFGGAVVEIAPAQLDQLLAALESKRPADADAARLRKAVLSSIPRRQRKQIEAFAWSKEQVTRYRRQRAKVADEIALVLSRRPGEAIGLLAEADGVSHSQLATSKRMTRLLRFCISDDYARGCRDVW